MMVYVGFSAFMIVFIYFNVLGLFRGYWKMPDCEHKRTLWKFKKLEIIEKAVQCAILTFMIMSMYWFPPHTATIALIGLAVMMAIEYVFGSYMRKAFLCPNCGGPIWEGNFIVILQPWRICPHCDYPLEEASLEKPL